MINQEKMLAYVRDYLVQHGAETSTKAEPRSFRIRSEHIRRVCIWLDRLMVQGGVDDLDALRMAAAFHDVGYAAAGEGHGKYSAPVLLAYAQAEGIAEKTAQRAAYLVENHSEKQMLSQPDTPMDLVLLMEADLLDEEGAMGIVFDCLSASVIEGPSYQAAYERMQKYEPPRLLKNPMVTPLAKEYWRGKQKIIRAFLRAYAFDLGMQDEA